jgi:hypothetical protein
MDASDEEFRRAWQQKFPDQGSRVNAPVSFGSRGTSDIPTEEKQKARRAFLDEVAKLQDQGRGYDEAWALAGMQEPSKSALATWARGAEAEKTRAKK